MSAHWGKVETIGKEPPLLMTHSGLRGVERQIAILGFYWRRNSLYTAVGRSTGTGALTATAARELPTGICDSREGAQQDQHARGFRDSRPSPDRAPS
jgi:hypothetical protein